MVNRVINNVTYTLTYDAENRLVSYSGGSINASFVYDGDGLSVRSTLRVQGTINGVTTTYIGNSYEAQGATTRKYYFAGSQRIAVREKTPTGETLSFFLADHLGGTNLTVKEDGTLQGELRYSAWGETRFSWGTTPTNARYTGRYSEPDLGGLMFYGARWYDSSLGRFVSPDSIIPGAGNPIAWDRYAYSNNNPINYNDPSGHWPEWNNVFDWVQGALYQYANDMSMGLVDQIAYSNGVCMDCNQSDAYYQGQQAGRIASTTVATVDQVTGAFVAAAGAAGVAPTAGGGAVCALATGGACAIPAGAALVVEGGMVVAGTAAATYGTGVIAFAKNKPVSSRSQKMNPSESKIWGGFDNYKGKVRTSGTGRNQQFYRWDYTHGDIEVFDRNGNHLGSMDPKTGKMYKDPVPGRTLDK